MATKKKAAAKPAAKSDAAEQQPAQPSRAEPHEVNSSLASPRMKALLEDHRKMGSRP